MTPQMHKRRPLKKATLSFTLKKYPKPLGANRPQADCNDLAAISVKQLFSVFLLNRFHANAPQRGQVYLFQHPHRPHSQQA